MFSKLKNKNFKFKNQTQTNLIFFQDFVDIIMKKLDDDQDGIISFNDFRKVVKKCPLMLQSLGQVFPERLAVHAFATTFKEQPDTI